MLVNSNLPFLAWVMSFIWHCYFTKNRSRVISPRQAKRAELWEKYNSGLHFLGAGFSLGQLGDSNN